MTNSGEKDKQAQDEPQDGWREGWASVKEQIPPDILKQWDGRASKIDCPAKLEDEARVRVRLFNADGSRIVIEFPLWGGATGSSGAFSSKVVEPKNVGKK